MNCPKCKRNIEQSSRYCNYCGINISEYKRKKTNVGVSTLESMKNYIELTKPRTNSQQIYLSSNKPKQTQQIQPQVQYYQITNSHQDQYNYSNAYSKVQQKVNTHQTQYNYSNKYSNVPAQPENTHQDQYNYSDNYNKSTKYISSDDNYIRVFIGEKYNQINESKFSIPTLLFGGFYLLYRKLWVYAIIWFILFIMFEFSIPIMLFINIFLASNFKKIYLYYAKLIVSDIKTKNPDKTSSEIMEICQNKGGVIHKINGAPIALIIIFLSTALVTCLGVYLEYKEEINIKTMNNQNLEYIIPTGYEKEYSDEYSETYKSNNECEIDIQIDPYNTDNIDTYMYKNSINSNNNILQKTINSNTWYQLIEKSTYYQYEYLGIDKDEKKYLITFSYPTENKNICQSEAKSFINTLKFKNNTIYNSEDVNDYAYN